MNKFICFGCWNNLNDGKGNLNGVMAQLESYIRDTNDTDKTDLIIVSGDNYYPDKTKIGKEKKHIIYPNKLTEGFQKLPQDIEIDIIMGNHDYETNTTKPKYFVREREDEEREEGKNCEITRFEMGAVSTMPNVSLNFFKHRFLSETGTLILMIDTSVYSSDVVDYLQCYNVFLENKGLHFATSEDLINYQTSLIIETIQQYLNNGLNKIIMVGHHPITGYKYKEENVRIIDDIPSFLGVLEDIYTTTKDIPQIKYYYLCADYHSYQHGYITLDSGMEIEQYIAGIGGTELDPDLPPSFVPSESQIEPPPGITSYTMEKNVHDWGFLVCRPGATELTCEPIFLQKGGKKRKHTKRKKISNRKKYKKYTKKHKKIKKIRGFDI